MEVKRIITSSLALILGMWLTLVLSGCLIAPSRPLEGAYVLWDGQRLTVKAVPCWQRPEGFQSATLETNPFDGSRPAVLWRIELPEASDIGANAATIGEQPPGYEIKTPFARVLTPKDALTARLGDDEGVSVSFVFGDLRASGFYSPAAATEEDLLRMRPAKFGCA